MEQGKQRKVMSRLMHHPYLEKSQGSQWRGYPQCSPQSSASHQDGRLRRGTLARAAQQMGQMPEKPQTAAKGLAQEHAGNQCPQSLGTDPGYLL